MSGNRVTIVDEHLVVEPLGLDRFWSFHHRIRIPLHQVVHAFHDPSLIEEPGRLRAPGLRLPGKIAGTFFSSGRRQFWNTAGTSRSIVITLATSAPFDRIVISVDDPRRVVDMVNDSRR